jgi:hypothetical protein
VIISLTAFLNTFLLTAFLAFLAMTSHENNVRCIKTGALNCNREGVHNNE